VGDFRINRAVRRCCATHHHPQFGNCCLGLSDNRIEVGNGTLPDANLDFYVYGRPFCGKHVGKVMYGVWEFACRRWLKGQNLVPGNR